MEESDPEIVNTIYQSGVTPLSATYIRMCFGGVGAMVLLLIYVFSKRAKGAKSKIQWFPSRGYCIIHKIIKYKKQVILKNSVIGYIYTKSHNFNNILRVRSQKR